MLDARNVFHKPFSSSSAVINRWPAVRDSRALLIRAAQGLDFLVQVELSPLRFIYNPEAHLD